MAERLTTSARWSRINRKLKSGEVAEKGNFACIDSASSGLLVAGSVATTLDCIGYFEDSFTGDGTKTINVRLWKEIDVQLLDNAASGTLADTDFGALVYIASTHEVTKTATGASVAGRCWGVTTQGVWVEPNIDVGRAG